MNIFIEGMERCGKTTLIKNLLKSRITNNLPTSIIHSTNYYFDTKEEHLNYSYFVYQNMFNIISNNNANFILDRAHLGEAVYGPIYRKYLPEDNNFIWNLEKDFLEKSNTKNYLIVLIDSSLQNFTQREDGLSLSKNIFNTQSECFLFTNAFQKSKINNKIIIDIKDKNIDDVKNIVLEFLKNGK